MSATSQLLRTLREQKGLSQADCAKALGIDRTTYAKYENGGSVKRNVEKLSAFFGVSTDTLLHGLLGNPKNPGHFAHDAYMQQTNSVAIDPSPSYFTDPETRALMEKMQNDPHHRRIFLASKDLKPDELDKIADLMETIINARKSKEEPL